jgi:hypothetical protein
LTGAPGTAGQNATTAFGTGSLFIQAAQAAWVVLPGLDMMVDVPANSKVLVMTDGGSLTAPGFPAGSSATVDLALFVDQGLVADAGWRRVVAMNLNGVGIVPGNWSFGVTLTLPAGQHRFQVAADVTAGVDATLSGNSASINQGQLTVVILKQ